MTDFPAPDQNLLKNVPIPDPLVSIELVPLDQNEGTEVERVTQTVVRKISEEGFDPVMDAPIELESSKMPFKRRVANLFTPVSLMHTHAEDTEFSSSVLTDRARQRQKNNPFLSGVEAFLGTTVDTHRIVEDYKAKLLNKAQEKDSNVRKLGKLDTIKVKILNLICVSVNTSARLGRAPMALLQIPSAGSNGKPSIESLIDTLVTMTGFVIGAPIKAVAFLTTLVAVPVLLGIGAVGAALGFGGRLAQRAAEALRLAEALKTSDKKVNIKVFKHHTKRLALLEKKLEKDLKHAEEGSELHAEIKNLLAQIYELNRGMEESPEGKEEAKNPAGIKARVLRLGVGVPPVKDKTSLGRVSNKKAPETLRGNYEFKFLISQDLVSVRPIDSKGEYEIKPIGDVLPGNRFNTLEYGYRLLKEVNAIECDDEGNFISYKTEVLNRYRGLLDRKLAIAAQKAEEKRKVGNSESLGADSDMVIIELEDQEL